MGAALSGVRWCLRAHARLSLTIARRGTGTYSYPMAHARLCSPVYGFLKCVFSPFLLCYNITFASPRLCARFFARSAYVRMATHTPTRTWGRSAQRFRTHATPSPTRYDPPSRACLRTTRVRIRTREGLTRSSACGRIDSYAPPILRHNRLEIPAC